MQPFTNQAQLSYNGITTSSNIARGQIVDVLSATKTAVTPEYSEGTEEVYVVTIVNAGTTPYTALTLSDDLGAFSYTPEGQTDPITLYPLEYVENSILYYIDGVLQATPAVTTEEGLLVSGINIPAGSDAVIVYAARVTEFAPLDVDGQIINSVSVIGTGLAAPLTATETIDTEETPDLSIIKSLSPDTVPGNGAITYTFDILNRGNTDAVVADDVTVTDTFDPALTDITVALNGDPLPAGSYTYDETTGQFATVPGVITVPAATFIQNEQTGAYTIIPGETILTVSGTFA